MKECFHFTKSRFLKSILENGLQPSFGTNCSIIGDGKGEKVSYSIGTEQATKMFKGVYEIYCRMADGVSTRNHMMRLERKLLLNFKIQRILKIGKNQGFI